MRVGEKGEKGGGEEEARGRGEEEEDTFTNHVIDCVLQSFLEPVLRAEGQLSFSLLV